jgi:lysophospholipase L1-like esterase
LIAELGLRIVWRNPYRDETTDHVLVLPIHHPGRDWIFSRARISTDPAWVEFRVDDRGYIRPSHQFDNADMTIAFVGGSTTECMAVAEPLRFPALVSTLLAKRGVKVNTLTAALASNTTHDDLNVLINHVIEDRPDVVILMEAWSDHNLLSHQGSYHRAMGAPFRFSSTMRWALQKEASSQSRLAGLLRTWAIGRLDEIELAGDFYARSKTALPVGEFASRLRAFVRVSKAFGITPGLMTQPFAKPRDNPTAEVAADAQDTFNEAIRQVGVEEDVLLIDLARHFSTDVPGWDEPMVYFYDRIHVTDRGSQEEASYIAHRLAETILAPRLASKQSRAGSR